MSGGLTIRSAMTKTRRKPSNPNVLPRVQSHLSMIGEDEPWEPLWISIYNAKCLTLDSYRHGRVMFAGDAGHLVPIFRGAWIELGPGRCRQSGWKLARVLDGRAPESLLDTYSTERVHATPGVPMAPRAPSSWRHPTLRSGSCARPYFTWPAVTLKSAR